MAAKQPNKMKPGNGKVSMAALSADVPRSPAEEVSRIQAPAQDTERPKRETKPKSEAKAKPEPKAKTSPKKKSVSEPKPEPAPLTLEVCQAQPMKQVVEQFVETHHKREPDPPSDSSPEPPILPMISKVLDSHEIMEYLSDCEFRLDASTAKHGDTYRLFVDDYPTDMAIVCKAGRCTIGNKSHPSPADAARAICDALLARIRAGAKLKAGNR